MRSLQGEQGSFRGGALVSIDSIRTRDRRLILVGLWLSTSFTTQYDEATVTKFLEGMRERSIPVEVFHYVSRSSPCVRV